MHVSGHGEGKEASVARVGRLCGHFVDKPDATIRVVVYRIRFQTPQNVVKTATDYANGQFRDGEYNLISKNCQHFATLCAVGFEECGDTKKILNYLMTLGILPGLVLLML